MSFQWILLVSCVSPFYVHWACLGYPEHLQEEFQKKPLGQVLPESQGSLWSARMVFSMVPTPRTSVYLISQWRLFGFCGEALGPTSLGDDVEGGWGAGGWGAGGWGAGGMGSWGVEREG